MTVIGRVISKQDGYVKTPNHGTLVSLETDDQYDFSRPDGETGKWNVKKYDIVTFNISGSKAVDVTLLKKHKEDTVFSVL